MSTTVTEYVCPDCGTLLRHSNPTTLESMRDVHNQLCIVKRQKTMAAQVAAPKPAAAAASVTTAKTPAAHQHQTAPPAAIPAATVAPAPARSSRRRRLAQPRYHSLAQEQATAQQKAQLTPSSKKKDR